MKSPVTMLKDLAGRLAGAKTALAELHTTDKALRRMAEELAAERSGLESSLPPPEEVEARLAADVDTLRAEWRRGRSLEVVNASQPPAIAMAAGSALIAAIGQLDFPALCGLVPDLVKAGIASMIRAAPFESGPPLADRPQLQAELAAKLADVESRHSELVDQALELGIALTHLPSVAGRRTQAAQAHERWSRDVAANRAYYERHPELKPPEPVS